jgi:hypothetical protein
MKSAQILDNRCLHIHVIERPESERRRSITHMNILDRNDSTQLIRRFNFDYHRINSRRKLVFKIFRLRRRHQEV